jgi:hypothetical protein
LNLPVPITVATPSFLRPARATNLLSAANGQLAFIVEAAQVNDVILVVRSAVVELPTVALREKINFGVVFDQDALLNFSAACLSRSARKLTVPPGYDDI